MVRSVDSELPAGAPAPPLAPPPGTDVAVPALKPLTPQEQPKLPSEVSASPPSRPSPIKPIPEPKGATKAGAKPAAPEAVAAVRRLRQQPPCPRGPKPPPPIRRRRRGPAGLATQWPRAPGYRQGFSLSVPGTSRWPPQSSDGQGICGWSSTGARGRYQAHAPPRRRSGDGGRTAPSRDATILRLLVQPDYVPSVRRDGLLWVVDLMHQPAEPREPIGVTAPAVLPTGLGILLGVADAGNVVTVARSGSRRHDDGGAGDCLRLPASFRAGIHLTWNSCRPFRVSPWSRMSMVWMFGPRAAASPSACRPVRDCVCHRMPARPIQLPRSTPHEGFFDVGTWKRGGRITSKWSGVWSKRGCDDPALRPFRRAFGGRPLLFANGYGPGGLGFSAWRQRRTHVGRSAAPFAPPRRMSGVDGALDLALTDLDSPLVKDDPESRIWQAAAHLGNGELPVTGARPWRRPARFSFLSEALGLASGRADVSSQSPPVTTSQLSRVSIFSTDRPSKVEEAQLDYLHGPTTK